MLRTLNTLIGRLALLQLLMLAIMLPALFYTLETVAVRTAVRSFTQHARAYATSLARELELGDVLDSASRTVEILDGGVDCDGCVYAAVEMNGRLIGSSVAETPAWIAQRGDDVRFDRSADGVYAVAVPVRREGVTGSLYLGFDKQATLEQVRSTRVRIAEALAAYGIASIAVAILLARVVALPLMQLRTASRKVAQGDAGTQLHTNSTMVEIVDLSRDLEFMRNELVGIAERLRNEMRQRQLELAERAALERQLQHEQRLATIGTFAGGLAHEFNNILVPLMLYTEESLDQIEPTHPVRENLARILRASSSAASLIHKLLAFTRPLEERQHEPIDVAAVTNEALDLSQALMPANIHLDRQVDDLPVRVLGDATLFSQVVLNLCSNAVHAMRELGDTLSVRLTARDARPMDGSQDGHPLVELRVQDTGGGMNPETQERIFEPFFTTRDVGEGSGLGLSIVHGIVASMGGRIRVASTLGAGTEFIVELPGMAPATL